MLIRIKKLKKSNKELLKCLHSYYNTRLKVLEWKKFFKELIRYIEYFKSNSKYKNIDDVLEILWLKKEEINTIKDILYKKDSLESPDLEKKVKNLIK